MKIIVSLISLSFACSGLYAQLNPNPPPIIAYGYDAVGNRISRQVIFVNAKLSSSNDSIPDYVEKGLTDDSDEEAVENSIETAFKDKLGESKVNIFPNPVTEQLSIKIEELGPETKTSIAIHDMNGKLLYHEEYSLESAPISFINYSAGNYVLRISINNEHKEWLVVKE